jgi:hypothetical protein
MEQSRQFRVEAKMVSAIKTLWLLDGPSLSTLGQFVRRVLAPDHLAVDSLPEALKRDIGLDEHVAPRERNDLAWSSSRRLIDTIRPGPL